MGEPEVSRTFSTDSLRTSHLAAVIVLLGALPHLPTIVTGYFQGDDFGFVRLFYFMPFREFFTLFRADLTQGLWGLPYQELRPMIGLFYKLDVLLWNLNPTGFHTTNVALHAINSLLVFSLSHKLFDHAKYPAFLAAAFFALAPVHAEPISWINGRVDLLPALFSFGSFWSFACFVRSGSLVRLGLSVLLFAIGLFAKESVVVLPLMIGFYLIWHDRYKAGHSPRGWLNSLAILAPFFLVLAAYVVLRTAVFGSAINVERMGGSPITRFLGRQPLLIGSLLFPVELFGPGSTVGNSIRLPLLVLSGVTGLILLRCCLLAWWKRPRDREMTRDLMFLGPVWYVLSVLPMLGAGYYAYRHLYVASAGVAMALAQFLVSFEQRGSRQWTRWSRSGIVCLLFLYGFSLPALGWEWARAGQLSRKMHEGVESLSAGIPRGSTIILVKTPTARRYVWHWALPHALQPPFSNVYLHHPVVEGVSLFCCENWWDLKRPIVEKALMQSSSPLYVFYWDETRNELAKSIVSQAKLQKAYEEVFQRPFSSAAISEKDAVRLFDRLSNPSQ